MSTQMPSRREMAGQIGAVVLELIKARVRDETDGHTKFTDADEEWGAAGGFGSYTSMQGLRAAMGGLMAVPSNDTLWAAAMPHVPSLLDEWRSVLSDPERFASCKPYAGYEKFDELLGQAGASDRTFTDATSWLLSTALVVHRVLPALAERGVALGDVQTQTQNAVIEALKLLIDAQLQDGGWSFGGYSPTASGHLFFTWGVLQGFADFSDYVLGESKEEIGVDEDEHLMAVIGQDLIAKFKNSRERASAFLKTGYLDHAVKGVLNYKLLASTAAAPISITVEEVGGEIPLLYACAYLQESLILNGVDKDGIDTIGYAAAQAAADMKVLQDFIRVRFQDAQYQIENTSDRATAVNISTLFLRAKAKKKIGPTAPPEYVFKDPSLWPQLVRTFVLYPYYVDRTNKPDPFAFDAFALLMRDRRSAEEPPGIGLWDHDAFNLSVTSRAVEALIDIYDYVELFEVSEIPAATPASYPTGEPHDLASMLAAAIAPQMRLLLRENSSVEQSRAEPDFDRFVEEIRQQVDLAVQSPFKFLPDEIDRKWKQFSSLPFDRIASEVHGSADASQFARDDKVAYAVFRSMTGVAFYAFAKCLPHLIEQALVYVATPEQRSRLRRKMDKKAALHEQILQYMQSLVQRLIDGDELPSFEGVTPDVAEFPPAKPKPKTR